MSKTKINVIRHEMYAEELLSTFEKNPSLSERQKKLEIVAYLNLAVSRVLFLQEKVQA